MGGVSSTRSANTDALVRWAVYVNHVWMHVSAPVCTRLSVSVRAEGK